MDYKAIHHQLQLEFEQDRTNTHVINQLAIACMEINDYYEAFRLFQMNSELNPCVESLTNMAYFYFAEGEPDNKNGRWINREEEAIRLLEKTLLLSPATEIPSALLGEILADTGRWTEAKRALELSIQVKPTLENLYNLGSVLYQLGQLDKASKLFWRVHLLKSDNYDYVALYYYVTCQIKLGGFPEQEILELEDALGNKFTAVDKDRLANIYYEMNQFSKVVAAYEDTKLWYSPDWVLPYFYSLIQCNYLGKSNELRDKVLLHIAERIQDCEQDDDEEFTLEDRQRCMKEIEADKQAFLKGFEKIMTSNYRPSITVTPQTETKCYLFGCLRHGNSNYTFPIL
ncbi:hypothetical protein [Paenibacillus sp. BAC0078]